MPASSKITMHVKNGQIPESMYASVVNGVVRADAVADVLNTGNSQLLMSNLNFSSLNWHQRRRRHDGSASTSLSSIVEVTKKTAAASLSLASGWRRSSSSSHSTSWRLSRTTARFGALSGAVQRRARARGPQC